MPQEISNIKSTTTNTYIIYYFVQEYHDENTIIARLLPNHLGQFENINRADLQDFT